MAADESKVAAGAGRDSTCYRCIKADLIEQWLVHCGWIYEWDRGAKGEAILEARHALAKWVGLGLPLARDDEGSLLFDPAEVLHFMKMVGRAGRDRLWREQFVETGRNMVREFHSGPFSAEPPAPPKRLPPRRFRVRLSREFNLEGIEPGRRLLLRLPFPLEDRALYDLKVDSVSSSLVESEVICAGGRLEWRVPAPPQPCVTISADYEFTAEPTVSDPKPDQLTTDLSVLYTRPHEGLIQISPRIAALAKQIAGLGKDSYRQLQAIWGFILDHFTVGLVHYGQIGTANPGEWVLDHGVCDCQLGCALLIALCRSLDIPARLAGGYVLYSVAPSQHYWAEIFIADRGWVPVDLSCWELSLGGQHKEWRNYFLGSLDYRLKTEQLPRHFTGLSTIRLPSAWHILHLPLEAGVEVRFLSVKTGHLIYRDRVVMLPPHKSISGQR